MFDEISIKKMLEKNSFEVKMEVELVGFTLWWCWNMVKVNNVQLAAGIFQYYFSRNLYLYRVEITLTFSIYLQTLSKYKFREDTRISEWQNIEISLVRNNIEARVLCQFLVELFLRCL